MLGTGTAEVPPVTLLAPAMPGAHASASIAPAATVNLRLRPAHIGLGIPARIERLSSSVEGLRG
jgi:hypothetical protein